MPASIGRRLHCGAGMSDSPIRCTIDLDAPGKQLGHLRVRARRTRAAGRASPSRSSPSPRRRADRGRHRRRPRRRARGAGRRDQARARARAGGRHGPGDRHPVPLTGRVARLHPALAVGREHEPLVPREPRRHRGRAARALPLDRGLPAHGGRRRHPLRRPHRALPAVVGDALGRGRRTSGGAWSTGCSPGTRTGAASTSTSPGRGSSSARPSGRGRR